MPAKFARALSNNYVYHKTCCDVTKSQNKTQNKRVRLQVVAHSFFTQAKGPLSCVTSVSWIATRCEVTLKESVTSKPDPYRKLSATAFHLAASGDPERRTQHPRPDGRRAGRQDGNKRKTSPARRTQHYKQGGHTKKELRTPTINCLGKKLFLDHENCISCISSSLKQYQLSRILASSQNFPVAQPQVLLSSMNQHLLIPPKSTPEASSTKTIQSGQME